MSEFVHILRLCCMVATVLIWNYVHNKRQQARKRLVKKDDPILVRLWNKSHYELTPKGERVFEIVLKALEEMEESNSDA